MNKPNLQPPTREALQMENDFLKMKLMLEKGAVFGGGDTGQLSPEMENEFLQSIIEMEAQFGQCEMVTVYEKIGRPAQFKAAAQLTDLEIGPAWYQLYDCLCAHSIQLEVCSPYISERELYRFVTEELFLIEIEAYDPPGVVSVFTYDLFHPDPFYDNPETAVDLCLKDLFRPKAFDQYYYMMRTDIQLNETTGLTLEEYVRKISAFYSLFERSDLLFLEDTGCRVNETESIVTGHYSIKAISGSEELIYTGNWTVTLVPDEERYFWYVRKILVEGFPI